MQDRYLGRVTQRLRQALPTVLGMIAVTFFLTRDLPGNPAASVIGVAATESLPWQFWHYITQLFQGDLGHSLRTGAPVLETLVKRLPASLELTFSSFLLCMLIAIPLGILAAKWPDSWLDRACRWVTAAGVALPILLMALFFIYLFHDRPGWSPPPRATGFGVIDSLVASDSQLFWRAFKQLVLPAITLGMFAMVPLMRLTQDAVAQVLASEFIRMARASGLSRRRIWWTYALRNAMLPVLSALGMVLSLLLGASVLVETMFAWPGIGALAAEALAVSDVAVVQGVVLFMAGLLMLLNLGVDLLYICVDPRVHVDVSLK